MPQLVTHTARPGVFRINDLVVSDGVAYQVATIESKSKYAYVVDTNGDKHRLDVTRDFTVKREEPTDEEKQLERRAMVIEMIEREATHVDQRVEDAKAKMIETLDYAPGSHWSAYTNLIEAQTAQAMWIYVHRVNNHAFDGQDVVSALASFIAEEAEDTLWQSDRRSSRSTSTMSNAIKDVQWDTKVAWLRAHRTWTRGTGATVLD